MMNASAARPRPTVSGLLFNPPRPASPARESRLRRSAAASGSPPGSDRRDRQRRRRTLLGILRQATQDHALDRRIEIAHDRGRRRHRAGVVELLQIAERLRVVGAAAGEESRTGSGRAP